MRLLLLLDGFWEEREENGFARIMLFLWRKGEDYAKESAEKERVSELQVLDVFEKCSGLACKKARQEGGTGGYLRVGGAKSGVALQIECGSKPRIFHATS